MVVLIANECILTLLYSFTRKYLLLFHLCRYCPCLVYPSTAIFHNQPSPCLLLPLLLPTPCIISPCLTIKHHYCLYLSLTISLFDHDRELSQVRVTYRSYYAADSDMYRVKIYKHTHPYNHTDLVAHAMIRISQISLRMHADTSTVQIQYHRLPEL
jgi:hypothetical protein